MASIENEVSHFDKLYAFSFIFSFTIIKMKMSPDILRMEIVQIDNLSFFFSSRKNRFHLIAKMKNQ